MFGLWIFGIVVGIIYGAFYKVKYGKSLFNGLIVGALTLWILVVPTMLMIFWVTGMWDGLQWFFKMILKSDDPIDSVTLNIIEWIKEEVINFD